jgi:hypothetical protein
LRCSASILSQHEQQRILKHVETKLGIRAQDDWYNVTIQQLRGVKGGNELLAQHKESNIQVCVV